MSQSTLLQKSIWLWREQDKSKNKYYNLKLAFILLLNKRAAPFGLDEISRTSLHFVIYFCDIQPDYAEADHDGASDKKLEQNDGRKSGICLTKVSEPSSRRRRYPSKRPARKQ